MPGIPMIVMDDDDGDGYNVGNDERIVPTLRR